MNQSFGFCMWCDEEFATKDEYMQHALQAHPPGKEPEIADHITGELRELLTELRALTVKESDIIRQIGVHFRNKNA